MNWYFASGDLDFFWDAQLRALGWLPQVFRKDIGFGVSGILSLWIDYPFRLVLKLLSTLGFSWFIIEKLLWLSVFALAIYSSYKLARLVLGKYAYLAPIIYTVNTYFLLLFSGGQLGVALAYALAPLVLLKFTEKNTVVNGLWLALLVACDLRIAYLTIGAIVLYMMLEKKLSSFYAFALSVLVACCIHLFWILPTTLTGTGPGALGQDFVNPAMLKFFSFADFSHALSLLHPNWPENLFGKVYFLQPEFIVLPILAFAAFLFPKQKTTNRDHLAFFALIALVGAFFAKGVNEPLGGIFQWMFIHMPGFVMFRDPTKFYLYTAIGYSVLIPFTLERCKKSILSFIFIIFWVFSIRAVFLGQVQGNFRPITVPAEYVQLKNLLAADSVPSRSLWIPSEDKFAFSSDVHPIVTASTAAFIDTSVKYVIVPRKKLVADLSKTQLKPIASFHDIAVFENPDFSGMHVEIPPIVEKQQLLANIGLGVSIVFLILLRIVCRKS